MPLTEQSDSFRDAKKSKRKSSSKNKTRRRSGSKSPVPSASTVKSPMDTLDVSLTLTEATSEMSLGTSFHSSSTHSERRSRETRRRSNEGMSPTRPNFFIPGINGTPRCLEERQRPKVSSSSSSSSSSIFRQTSSSSIPRSMSPKTTRPRTRRPYRPRTPVRQHRPTLQSSAQSSGRYATSPSPVPAKKTSLLEEMRQAREQQRAASRRSGLAEPDDRHNSPIPPIKKTIYQEKMQTSCDSLDMDLPSFLSPKQESRSTLEKEYNYEAPRADSSGMKDEGKACFVSPSIAREKKSLYDSPTAGAPRLPRAA